jgi:tetratricopeptide (TPR) repeat protein
MSQVRYEQYKDALRRGHVAALRGRLDTAVAAYEAAAELAPDRALPYVGLGDVLRRLGHVDAAEGAYTAALARAPDHEGALRGRAELRVASGRRVAAADDFEALAATLERADRATDACDAARRALELAESRERRRSVERLAARLRALDADPAVAEALRLAMLLLEPVADLPADAGQGGPAEGHAGLETASDELAGRPAVDADGAEDRADDEPGSEAAVPADPGAVLAEAQALLDAGDVPGARTSLLALAAGLRRSGRLDAALDACFILMAIDPSDTAVQLEVAANQVERGWTVLAADKVRLLARLAELDPGGADAEAVARFAARHGLAGQPDHASPGAERTA